MKKFLLIFLFAGAFSAHALPPQAEADKLMIEARAAMDAREYSTAVQSFGRAEKLKARLPPTISFHYGVALMETGAYVEAKQQLNKYISSAGRNGKFYKEALEAYAKTEAKEVAAVKRAREVESANAQAVAEYNNAKLQYDEQMRMCPGEYKRYAANLEGQFMALVRECESYGKYGCTQYHDDRRAIKLMERLDTARERHENREYEGSWCERRYTAPKRPIPQ